MPSSSTGSRISVENVYPVLDCFHFRGLLGLVFEKFRDVGNVANLKNIIIWSISTVW